MAQLLIHNNKVIQVERTKFPVHKDLQWVTGEGKVGDSYIDGTIVPYIQLVEVKTYKEKRREAYPRIEEQLDVLHKQFMHMANVGEITLSDEASDMINRIEHIKSIYPKPTE